MDITGKHTLITDSKGKASLDLSDADDGSYTCTYDFNGDLNYDTSTNSKAFSIITGAETRILVNNEDLTSLSGKYYDNTILKLVLQYKKDSEWVNKQTYSLNVKVTETSDTYTVNNTSNTVNLSKYNVGTYNVVINYAGDTGFSACSKTVVYTQSKNDINILNVNDLTVYDNSNVYLTPKISTIDGNVIPNVIMSMLKQNINYTSISNNDGVCNFNGALDYVQIVDYSDDCSSDKSSNYTGTLSFDTDHYVLTSSNFMYPIGYSDLTNKRLEVDISSTSKGYILLSFNGSEIVIYFTDTTLSIKKKYEFITVNRNSRSVISVELHNNVLKVFNDDVLICSLYEPNTFKIFMVHGEGSVYNLSINSIPTTENLASETVTYSVADNSNVNDKSVSNTINLNEFKTFDLNYKIDNYDTNRLLNINSSISIPTTDLTGYGMVYNSADNVTVNKPSTSVYNLNDYYASDYSLSKVNNLLFYAKKENTAISTVTPIETVNVEDWSILDKADYTGLNIVLEADNSSVILGGTYNLTARVGVKGKTVTLYENNTSIGTGTTGDDGTVVFNYTKTTAGVYNYIVKCDAEGVYPSASSNKLAVTVSKKTASLSLVSSASSVSINGTFTLDCLLGVEGKTLYFYKGSTLLGTGVTGTAGIASYTVTASTYGNGSYKAVLNEDSEYYTSESNVVVVSTNKISTSLTGSISKSSVNVNEEFTLSATISPVIEGVNIEFSDVDANFNTINTAVTDSEGIATITHKEVSDFSGQYEADFFGNDMYGNSSVKFNKPTIITDTSVDTAITVTSGSNYYKGWSVKGTLLDENNEGVVGVQVNGTISSGSTVLGVYPSIVDANGEFSFIVSNITDSQYYDVDLNLNVSFDGYNDYNASSKDLTIKLLSDTELTATTSSIYNFNTGAPYKSWRDLDVANVVTADDGLGIKCGNTCSDSPIASSSGTYNTPAKLAVITDISIPSGSVITGIRTVYRDRSYACSNNAYMSIGDSTVGVYNSDKTELGTNNSTAPSKGVYASHTYDLSGEFASTSNLNLLISYPKNTSSNPGLLFINYIKVILKYRPVQS